MLAVFCGLFASAAVHVVFMNLPVTDNFWQPLMPYVTHHCLPKSILLFLLLCSIISTRLIINTVPSAAMPPGVYYVYADLIIITWRIL